MNDAARQTLCEMIARFGVEIVQEPMRVEGLLRDLCPGQRREIFVLVSGLKERVASDLLGASVALPRAQLVTQLARRLSDNLGLDGGAARWAVESWALALRVVALEELVVVAGEPEDDEPAEEAPRRESPAPPLRTPLPGAFAREPPAAAPTPAAAPVRRTLQLDATPDVETMIVSKLGRGHATTIGRAIEKARPGTRILVRPGVYNEGLILDRPVEIVGDGPPEEIILDATDSDCVSMFADYAVLRGLTLRGRAAMKGKEFFAVDVTRGRLVIEECDITSDSLACVAVHGPAASPILRHTRIHDGRQGGLMVYEGAEATVEDCDFAGNTAGLIIGTGANPVVRRTTIHDGKTGVYVYEKGRGVLEDCVISGNGTVEVQVRSGGNPTLRRCKIRDGRSFGLYVFDGGAGAFEDCDFFGHANSGVVIFQGGNPALRRCRVRDGAAEGIYVFEGGRGLLEDCDVFGNRNAGVVIMQGSQPVLHRSAIHDGESVGVYVSDQGQGLLHACDIFHHPGAGVQIDKAGSPQLRECRIHHQRARGVLVEDGGRGELVDCDIHDNGAAGIEIARAGDPVIRGCRVRGNATFGVAVHDGGAGTVEGSDLRGNAGGAFDVDATSTLRRGPNQV